MPVEPPCDRAERLRGIRDALITGDAVTETKFGEDAVKFAKADMAALNREIAAAEAACAASLGERPRRKRFAMGARFRPY